MPASSCPCPNPHFSSLVYCGPAIIRPGCVSLGRPSRRTVKVRLRWARSQALPGRPLWRLATTSDEKCGLSPLRIEADGVLNPLDRTGMRKVSGHPVNGEVGTWFGAFRIPNLVPRSLVNIVGCSSRGRGNCGKLRATSNWASKPVIRSLRCANGGKTTASTCQFSSRTSCFSTVCIVRQFPRPAFDWRHLPIYRMNQSFALSR